MAEVLIKDKVKGNPRLNQGLFHQDGAQTRAGIMVGDRRIRPEHTHRCHILRPDV